MIMQPHNREMQGINSLLNSSQISVQDLHNNPHQQQQQQQIQNSQMHHHQLNQSSGHFDPTSHDDFLEQMLSALPSCSWPELNPANPKPLWDLNPANSVHINGSDIKPIDLSDDATPSNADNVAFPYDEHANLASKFRNHQISGSSPSSKSTVAALMLQQQLLMSRGVSSGESGLLQMPLSLGGGDFERSRNDVIDGSPFKASNPANESSVQALYNGFTGSLHGTGQSSNQTQHFHHPQGQNFSGSGAATNQPPANGTANGAPAQPKPRVRARRGQATDPHSIAERLRRERIAERMKALQELVPNANKTDKASMLDEIIDYVKFLQLQVKVLSMSRLGGAAAVAPLVADVSSEGGGGDCIQATANGGRNSNGNQTASSSNDGLTMTEHQVAKLMEEDMGSAMQYLQSKGLCLMPISLATAISTATCHSRNRLMNGGTNHQGNTNNIPVIASNGEGPSSPSMSVLTVQSAAVANGGSDSSVKDAASVSKP
ncbi:hypothetical protein L6164_014202 [Bauhinia variegata]|uniref:Uncharacterized protein n=1 Tax=Bauhinia variegata TaxID=167791 RepID=A0ACB9NK72_BAUVA|nr:hypothetical protein L6164_014202 [Bauhinia variegata]